MNSFIKLIDFVLPPRCPFTGESVDSQGTVSPKAWAGLSFITSPMCHACGFPFEFSVPAGSGETLCAACLGERPEFSAARAALVYNDISRDFILKFKHGDQIQAVVAMVPWLRAAGADFWGKADAIMPVPLHRWRLLRRRYNQAGIMAQVMANDRKLAYLPDTLIRTRPTQTQGHLSASERTKNVKKAFAVPEKKTMNVRGKKIILMDDVYTTGATVRECTKALFKAGAAEVYILSLVRVVRAVRIT